MQLKFLVNVNRDVPLVTGDSKRSGDVTCVTWTSGRCRVCDVSCPTSLVNSKTLRPASASGAVASDAEPTKQRVFSVIPVHIRSSAYRCRNTWYSRCWFVIREYLFYLDSCPV